MGRHLVAVRCVAARLARKRRSVSPAGLLDELRTQLARDHRTGDWAVAKIYEEDGRFFFVSDGPPSVVTEIDLAPLFARLRRAKKALGHG